MVHANSANIYAFLFLMQIEWKVFCRDLKAERTKKNECKVENLQVQ